MIFYLKPYQTFILLPFVINRINGIFQLCQYLIGGFLFRYSQYYLHEPQLTRFVSLNSSNIFKSLETLGIDKRIYADFDFLLCGLKRNIELRLFITQIIITCWGTFEYLGQPKCLWREIFTFLLFFFMVDIN